MRSSNNYINPEDFARVLAEIPRLSIRKWLDEDIQFLFQIMYWCGLRPSEAIRLKKEDFDLESRKLSLGQTKTRKNDYAPIPARFVTKLASYLEFKEDGRLFDGLSYNTVYPWILKLGKWLEIPAWTTHRNITGEATKLHLFRKSIGKDMLTGIHLTNNGTKFSIPVISKHLRHSKPSITIDSYLKSTIETVLDEW